MLILKADFKEKFLYNTYIALGSFDGLHRGHLDLIRKTVELSKENHCKSMVYTFNNHPMSVIGKGESPKLIQNNQDKIETFKKENIDIVRFINFDKSYMKITPEEFITNLLKLYNVKGIIVGFNYKFGYKNKGDIKLLKDLSKKFKFELYIRKPVTLDKEIISSTKIRNLIIQGNISKANNFLSRPFSLSGKVIGGKKLGRKLGFPTINLDYNKESVLPLRGVYYTIVKYNNNFYKGITNVGFNPTVNGKYLNVETHILNFNKEIYDEVVKIYFIERMREEQKFNSIDELIKTLENDKKYAAKKDLNHNGLIYK